MVSFDLILLLTTIHCISVGNSRRLYSNLGPLLSEATNLSAVPQPLPCDQLIVVLMPGICTRTMAKIRQIKFPYKMISPYF